MIVIFSDNQVTKKGPAERLRLDNINNELN